MSIHPFCTSDVITEISSFTNTPTAGISASNASRNCFACAALIFRLVFANMNPTKSGLTRFAYSISHGFIMPHNFIFCILLSFQPVHLSPASHANSIPGHVPIFPAIHLMPASCSHCASASHRSALHPYHFSEASQYPQPS